ncbi:MAG: SusF/SusE family outer membrane protein [Candidatus Cryptobacteroides sp.]|nr:SusF/SusE family outer membrane protein [Candidatus Cryptobacteroides sp.]
MKTNKLIAAALLPLLFSCAKENLNQIDKPENADDYITVSLVPGEDAVTRASFDDKDGIFWQQGGFAGLVNAKANNIKSLALDKTYLYNGNNQASFKFTKSELTDKPGPYVLYYPHHDAVEVIDGKYKIPFTIEVTQTTEIGKSTEIFSVVSKNAIDLVPYKKEDTNEDTNYDNNGAEVYFKVVGSYIRILPYGGTKEGEVIDYIKIYDINNNHISGDYFVSVEVTGAENKPTTIALADGTAFTSNEMYVNFVEKPSTNIEKTAAKGIYAQVLPGKHQLAYEIHTKVGNMDCAYIFKSSKETDFDFGSIKDILLNIGKATKKSYSLPENLFIVGDGCEAGWDSSKAIKMDKSGNTFTKELYLRNGEGIEGIKFLTTNSDKMYPAYVNDGNGNLAYYSNDLGVSNPVDQKFNVKSGFGYYKVTVDFDTNKVSFELLSTPWLVGMGNWDKGQKLMPVEGEPGVFSITTEIWNDGGMKFVIRKSSDSASDIDYPNTYQLRAVSTDPIDFASEHHEGIVYDNKTYTLSKTETLTKEAGVTLWGPSDNAFKFDNSSDDKKLYLDSGYYKRIYNITLDMNNLKVTISPAHGTEYRLVGINDKWASSDDLPKATAVEGIVKWEGINVNTTAKGFKICGEYTFDNVYTGGSFYDGEWYYASLSFYKKWENNQWTDNYYWFTSTHSGPTDVVFESTVDRKWYIPESGTYDFEFNTNTLQLTVTKKQ